MSQADTLAIQATGISHTDSLRKKEKKKYDRLSRFFFY